VVRIYGLRGGDGSHAKLIRLPFEAPVTGAAFLGDPTNVAVMTSGLGQVSQLVKATLTPSSRMAFDKSVLGSGFHGDVESVSLTSCPSAFPSGPLIASMTKRGDVCIIDR
jgi:hypothetical protein